MTFTDDDLKYIKDCYKATADAPEILKALKIDALVARLEAAENAREHHAHYCVCDWCITWRNEAGK